MSSERPFSRTRRDLLQTVLERLIPTDDGAPGAADVIGVDGLIKALATPRYAADEPAVMVWLDALDRVVANRTLTPDQTDDLLCLIEAGQIPEVSAATFNRLVTITAELFYGSPANHAPERTTPAWEMLGYSPRPASRHD